MRKDNSYNKSVFEAVTAFFLCRLDNYPGGHINGRKNGNLGLQGSPGRACNFPGVRAWIVPGWLLLFFCARFFVSVRPGIPATFTAGALAAIWNTTTGQRCTGDTYTAATRALYAHFYHYSYIYTIIYYYIIYIYNLPFLRAVTTGGYYFLILI